MTINEIQSTLDQLRKRHPDLNEGLILTLLQAGGWDENAIQEAQMLFRSESSKKELPHDDQVFLPENPELLLSSAPEKTEELIPHNIPLESLHPIEKESLIVSEEVDNTATLPKLMNVIPENLPIKPFEPSPHNWAFSKYKAIFHGDTTPEPEVLPEKKSIPELKKEVPAQVETVAYPKKEAIQPIEVIVPRHIEVTKTPLTKEDEGLIAMAALFVVIVILLILYMYSNGRL